MRRLGNLVKKYATLLSTQYKSLHSFILKAHVQPKDIACCIEFCTDGKSENYQLYQNKTQACNVFWVNIGL